MICRECNSEMVLDDKDINFRGNLDKYWICDCGASCIEKIRYGRSMFEDWYLEKGNIVKSYMIRK